MSVNVKAGFTFAGHEFAYFDHPYNTTLDNERCVEVPIARWYAAGYAARSTLEVGNVLSHYGPVAHTIVDKHEQADGVLNVDIVDYVPRGTFDLILSISTFEHIGYDSDDQSKDSAGKILQAIEVCRHLLNPSGLMVITVPLGWNPAMDTLIQQCSMPTHREFYLRRVAQREWQQCDRDEAMPCRYGTPYQAANALLVAEFVPTATYP